VNIFWFFLALCQRSDFGVEFSRFHRVWLVAHGLLKYLVGFPEGAKKGEVDLGVGHLGSTTWGVVLRIAEQSGKNVDVVLN
jgi:hypothetical protein